MRRDIRLPSVALALGLAACSAENSTTFAGFGQPAGAFLDEGGFGVPTMNNTRIQNGDVSFITSLNTRFSNEIDPTVTFDFNSAVLDAASQAVLQRQADWIRQFPEIGFRVYGHTDLVGSDAYNRQLGLRRAQAVVAFLTSRGIDRSGLEAVASFGETQPVIVTSGRERRNRRTVTEVSGLNQRHPQVLSGKYAEVIFREYVESATERPVTEGGGLAEIATAAGG